MYFWKKKALLALKEATYGTDAAPTAANVVRAYDVSINPLEGDVVDRPSVMPYMGAGDSRLVGKHMKLSFSVEAAGSGTAGTAPAYKDLLKACGLAETVTAGTDVAYTPVSDGFDSISLHLNIDGVRYKVLGSRGNLSFDMQAKQIPGWKFDFVGLFELADAVALPAVNYDAYKDPVEPTEANTPTVQVHGADLILVSAGINLNTNPRLISRCNRETVQITDHPMTAELTVEKPTLATINFQAQAANHVRAEVKLVHGIVAGNIIEIVGPKAQITRLGVSQSEDIATEALSLSLKPDAGNDEIAITFK